MASISKEALFVLTIWMYVKCYALRCANFSSPHVCDKILKIPDNARSPWKISQIVVGMTVPQHTVC